MKILHRILLIGFIPLLTFLIVAGLNLAQLFSDYATFTKMEKNVYFFNAASNLVSHLQRERGGTALFLVGDMDLATLADLQQKTDSTLDMFVQSLNQSALNEQTKEKHAQVVSSLKQMRAAYAQPQVNLREKQIGEYTEFIQELINTQTLVPNGPTTRGFGKILSSLMILEVAKESAGRLRANGGSLLALDAPLSNDQFNLVTKLKSEVDVGLTSPALVLSAASVEILTVLPEKTHWQEVERIFRILLTRAQSGGYGVSGSSFYTIMTEKINDIDGVVRGETNGLMQRLQKEQGALNQTLMVSLGLMGILTIGVIIITIYFALNIVKRINTVIASLKDIAEGEGDLTVRLQSGRDELGVLSNYFNVFVENLQKMMVDVRTNAVSLAQSANQMTSLSAQVSRGASDTAQRSSTVSAAAEEMSANTASVAASMEETSTNLTSVASAAEEMSTTITDIAGFSDNARSTSNQAIDQARGMSDLMQELVVAAQEIGKVTEAITSISSQTNLLALNATIEAARAGESGRGFAVVANEIKELAHQTTNSADHIRQRIAAIQASTTSAQQVVQGIATVIENVGETIGTITASINEQATATREIVQNIAEATLGVQNANELVAESASVSQTIAQDIAGVHATTEDMTTASQEVNMGAEELSQLSGQLEAVVNRFRLE